MSNIDKFLLSNTFTLSAGFNIDSTEAIDSRFQVETKEDLYKDWANKNVTNSAGVNEAIYKYDGLITYVKSEGKSYRYNSKLGDTEEVRWELVPVTADDINSLVEIHEVDIQSISVNGETVTPVDGNVNITLPEIPEVVHPEYELVEGDTNSVKLLKDGESVGEVSISLTASVVKSDDPNVKSALSLATSKNIGKIILVSDEPKGSKYLNGTYIIDDIGSVKYLATTSGSSDEASAEELIDNAIKSLDSTISAEEGKFITSITITDGKLVSCEDDSVIIPEYTVFKTTNDTSTEYKLQKGGEAVGETIIVPKSEIINKVEVDSSITYEIGGESIVMQETLDANYKIKDVIADDKILAVDTNGDLSSTISIAHVKSEDGTKNEIVLRGIGGVQIGEPIDASEFVVDGFLDSVSYESTTHELVFVFNEYHEGVEGQHEVRVDLTAYIDNHTFNVVNGSWSTITITPTVSEDGTETVFNLSVDDSVLTTKLESMEGEIADNSDQIGDVLSMVEAIKQCTSGTISAATSDAGEGEVSVVSNAQVDLFGDGSSLTGSFTAVNVVTKQYVTEVETALDERITELENAEDADTKCTSATINPDSEVEVPTVDEVDVIKNVAIELSGDGTSLTGDATAVKVVTKQYVDSRYKIINSTEALFTITNSSNIWEVSNISNTVIDNITEEGLYQINYSNVDLGSGVIINGPVFIMSVQKTLGQIITQHFSVVGLGITSVLSGQKLSFIRYYENGSIDPSSPTGWSDPKVLNEDEEINNIVLRENKTGVVVPESDEFISVVSNTTIDLTYDSSGRGFFAELPVVQMPTQKYVDGKFDEVPTYTAITTEEIEAIFLEKEG